MALKTLAGIASSRGAQDGARVAACKEILERGYGKTLSETADEAEIRVVIRHIVDNVATSTKLIEHEPNT